VVWRLDRLGRSLKHLIETVTALKQQNIAFQSITENINTATATGQLVFHLFGALAEFGVPGAASGKCTVSALAQNVTLWPDR
jgi:DNA invertase Pin-like site-specific DNA recombinase